MYFICGVRGHGVVNIFRGMCFYADVDCVGSFGNFSACSVSCGSGVVTASYAISRAVVGGGLNCPYHAGETISKPCNTSPCGVYE